MSAIKGLNHITLAVGDLSRAVRFYVDGLDFVLRKQWAGGAYLEAGDIWLCLSVDDHAQLTPREDYTHLAFDTSLEEFEGLVKRVLSAGGRKWKENKSEGESFYFLDPDGHKLEIHVRSLKTRLEAIPS
ncbi:MAG: VOC family protein [Hyphomicrobiales bacterium]